MIINKQKIMNLNFLYSNIKLPQIYIDYLIEHQNNPLIFKYLIKHIIKNDKKLINECWLWSKHHDKDGYPKYLGEPVQRILWEITRQRKIEPNYVIRHTCDNPNCINPFHLLSGSQADNAKDKVIRGRSITCEAHSSTHLKNTDIPIIFENYINGMSMLKISKMFNVTEPTIRDILYGNTWKPVIEQYNINLDIIKNIIKSRTISNSPPIIQGKKLNKNDVINIRELYHSKKYTRQQLAQLYNIHPTHVTSIVNRKTWKHI